MVLIRGVETMLPTTKIPGWEDQLYEVIVKARGKVFSYEEGHNCFFFAMDCVKAQIGIDPFAGDRPFAKTKEAAAARLKFKGYEDVEEAIADCFKPCEPIMARRGDIAIVELGGAKYSCVFANLGLVGLMEKGITFLGSDRAKRAYKVGWE